MADIPANITTTATIETAPGLGGGSFSGKFETAGDTDFVKVRLEPGKVYTFMGSVDVLGDNDQSSLNIFDSTGKAIRNLLSSTAVPNPSGGLVSVDKAQDVFVEVKSLVKQTGEYGLFVSDVPNGITVFPDGGADTVFTGTELLPRLLGGGGDDNLSVGTGIDAFGEQGNDFINGNSGSNRLSGGLGDDQVFGSLGDDFVWGDAGDDFLEGNAGDDVVFGGSGADELFGLQDSDRLIGGDGADVLNGGDGADTVDYSRSRNGVSVDLGLNKGLGGDAGGDTFASIENVTGSKLADFLNGDAGANAMEGLAGNDTIAGRGDADKINGGADNDTVTYKDSAAGVTVNLAIGAATGGDAQGDQLISIENVTGSSRADTLTGTGKANVLQGLAGADTLDGGFGIDTASYADAAGGGVTVNLATGAATGSDAQGDKLLSIENLIGSAAGDALTGSGVINVLDGGSGNDTLTGGAGADRLIGGSGKDALVGGTSGDAFVFAFAGESSSGANRDRIADFSHAEGDRIDLAALDANPALAGDQGFSFIGKGAFSATGQVRFFAEGDHTVVEVNAAGGSGAELQVELTGHVNLVSDDFVL